MSDTIIQQSILNKSRKDKFLLVLNIPTILKEVNKASLNDRATKYLNQDSLQYSVFGSVVPTIAIPEVDANFSGQVAKYTSYNRPAYTSVTVKFTVDNEFNNWWALWYWLNLINNSELGYYNANKIPNNNPIRNVHSYETNITIFGLDEYNNKKIQFDYDRAFITGLGDISYDYRDASEMESSFTFTFSQLVPKLI